MSALNSINIQSFTGAPGELVDLKVGALDQGGNWQAAVWSLVEGDLDEENSTSQFNVVRNKLVEKRVSKEVLVSF